MKQEEMRYYRCQSRDPPSACGEDYADTGCPTAAHGGHHAGVGGCALKEGVFRFVLLSFPTMFKWQ